MATYFHQHHHHNRHHHSHHGNTSDIITPQASDGGLQTLILMNHPNFVGYSEPHAPTLYHAPPPLLPQLVGIPLHPSSESYAPTQSSHAQQHYSAWAQRESPRAQQGLSLTLSSNQNHSFSRAAHAEPDHLQPSPSGGSDSPAATTVASAGDVAALMTPSKYLKAVQELLEEVVNVSVDRVKPDSVKKVKITKGESPPDDSMAGDGPKEPAELTPADRQELQMKKAKLINLLDEVDQRQRQRQYHQQMQSVVASFEQVAGANSARTYTSLALKTISSQFRCLRGAISGQIRAANKALGEGEGEGAGPTSRLKMLDHQMRQQRALQQLGMIQNNAWRPQRGLPEKAVSVLRAWLFEHFLHPYPKDSDKIMLAKQTGLSRSQVSNWFINARVRLWKPMIEEMYAEEVKEHQQQNGTGNKDEPDDEKDDHNLGVGDDEAKAGENHSPSNVRGNNDPFVLVDNEAQGSCLKKQRNYDFTFPESEMFNNGCKEEQVVHHQTKEDDDCPIMPGSGSGFMGGLVSYPIGEIGRFGDDGQFSANFSGNGVSLTLGLPHCESLSLQGNNQAFLTNNSGIDQYRGRLEMGQLNPNSSHSGNAYGAQLLHDFVA